MLCCWQDLRVSEARELWHHCQLSYWNQEMIFLAQVCPVCQEQLSEGAVSVISARLLGCHCCCHLEPGVLLALASQADQAWQGQLYLGHLHC